jgi:hypothetical protein
VVGERHVETTAAMASQPPALMASIVTRVAEWAAQEKDWSRHVAELEIRRQPVEDVRGVLPLWESGREAERMRVRAAVRSLVKEVTVRIVAVTRYEKRVAALVEFHRCPETRAFVFEVPSGTSVVIKGCRREELLGDRLF